MAISYEGLPIGIDAPGMWKLNRLEQRADAALVEVAKTSTLETVNFIIKLKVPKKLFQLFRLRYKAAGWDTVYPLENGELVFVRSPRRF